MSCTKKYLWSTEAVAGGGGNWAMPPPKRLKGGVNMYFAPPPKHYAGPFDAWRAFLAPRTQKAHLSKLANVNTIFDPSQAQTELDMHPV